MNQCETELDVTDLDNIRIYDEHYFEHILLSILHVHKGTPVLCQSYIVFMLAEHSSCQSLKENYESLQNIDNKCCETESDVTNLQNISIYDEHYFKHILF